ncbi:MAG: M23 family metallopeptidase [SAR324 cluster bacterium]|nr:M23 family metallopeptidase [SAR324 cluster bacterium]
MYRSIRLNSEVEELHALKNQYMRQQIEFKKVSNEISKFRDQMSRLRELDYKLRLITDLEVERPNPSLYGIGGSMDVRNDGLTENVDLAGMDLLSVLDKDLERLKEMANYQEESFNDLKAFLVDQKDLLDRSPYRWPVRGFVSSNYGPRVDPFTGLQRQHQGVDIVTPKGTPVLAPADGIVTYTALDPTLGYMLVIDHGYGVITRYGHNDAILVREGQRVSRGDQIATVGSSGKSTGPHLHYEIRINDLAVNPLNYILE